MIQIKNGQFQWPGSRKQTLNIPYFSVKPKEKILITGQSGSGKSTLLSLITGIQTPDMGSIEICGKEITGLPQKERDRFRGNHMGYIFQQFNLIPYLSVVDNILTPLIFSKKREAALTVDKKERARELLRELNLKDYYDTPVTKLSIGQQQRVAVARALIGNPPLIIADEPTSALDGKTTEEFMQLLARECDSTGATLVMVSHNNSLHHYFDRTAPLESFNLIPLKEDQNV